MRLVLGRTAHATAVHKAGSVADSSVVARHSPAGADLRRRIHSLNSGHELGRGRGLGRSSRDLTLCQRRVERWVGIGESRSREREKTWEGVRGNGWQREFMAGEEAG